jgi:hypothetical protein
MTLHDILNRLIAEGYENCRTDGYQIIMNNRGEIDPCFGGGWQIYSRFPDLGWVNPGVMITDISELYKQIEQIWTKKEPK